jgi:hypothetical protein
MKNRVTFEYVSIIRRSADCASFVIESASSKIKILYGGHGNPGTPSPTVVDANDLIFPLTTDIPRSSEAFNSNTRFLLNSGPNSCLQIAKAQVVFPVPGGP